MGFAIFGPHPCLRHSAPPLGSWHAYTPLGSWLFASCVDLLLSSAAVKAEDTKREGSEMHCCPCIFTVSRWRFCGVARRVSRSRPSAPLHLYSALSGTRGRQVQADVALGSGPLPECQFHHFAHPLQRDQPCVHLRQCVIRRFQQMVYKSRPLHLLRCITCHNFLLASASTLPAANTSATLTSTRKCLRGVPHSVVKLPRMTHRPCLQSPPYLLLTVEAFGAIAV